MALRISSENSVEVPAPPFIADFLRAKKIGQAFIVDLAMEFSPPINTNGLEFGNTSVFPKIGEAELNIVWLSGVYPVDGAGEIRGRP